jgi:hypothetical protein
MAPEAQTETARTSRSERFVRFWRPPARERFVRYWGGLRTPELASPEEEDALRIAVALWSHRHGAAQRAKVGFSVAQFTAPVAAGTATVLAGFTSVSVWAVIPSAIATIASSLLASFGFRENWYRLRWLSRKIGFEIVTFAMGADSYRELDPARRVDLLMKKLDELSIKPLAESPVATRQRGPDLESKASAP